MNKRAFLLFCSLFILVVSAPAYAQNNFYKGKTITIIVGTKAGDAYDLYPRLMAEYLPKYIPGNPNVIIQNMPGAASIIAANNVYNVAKPDGLTIGAIYPALYFDQLSKKSEVRFDWSKFQFIGSPIVSYHLLYMRSDTPYKSIDDIKKASTPPKCGSNGTSSTGYWLPKLLDDVIGTKFDIVVGYQSGGDVDLAVERGEVQCRAFTITAWFAREPFISWRKNGFANVLFQTGSKREPRLKDAPTIYELLDKYKATQTGRQLTTIVLASGEFGRPLVFGPKVPTDRVKILREAFDRIVKDPGYLADAEKRKLDIEPIDGPKLQKLAQDVIASPPQVVEGMKKLMGSD
ncbi:MAG TPA: tripartite tricarboxylate transporter substrate-binding protein [Candidatus Binatia bacterium]|jgi:tripartite-type tricarboxylate transporter receptor subunit TctC|nr:tripartite tricarboxylate transporter substrate-binding protein [Candidatus Binatia bacterium]